MPLKKIEALMSGTAWGAAVKGSFPQNITTMEGVATYLPADLGAALATGQDALDAFSVLQSGDANSIIGVVIAAIKSIVGAITKAADQRQINYAKARIWYLANAVGLTKRSNLKDFWSDKGTCELTPEWPVTHCRPDTGYNGFWRYPRASVAEDRAVPYWDPLGTAWTCPPWVYPGGVEGPTGLAKGWGDSKGRRWPAIGNELPDACESWAQIGLGAKCTVGRGNCSETAVAMMKCTTEDGPYTVRPATIPSAPCGPEGCGWQRILCPDPVIFNAPWAFPVTSPSRLAGVFGKSSAGPEMATAALYMLPTYQHVITSAAQVAQWKKILLLAMERFHPKAYEAEPGNWRTTGGDDASGPWVVGYENSGGPTHGPDPYVGAKTPGEWKEYKNAVAGPGNTFAALAMAMARIRGFEECRAAMKERPDLLPDEITELLPLNKDFNDAERPAPKRKGRPPKRRGRSSGGGGLLPAAALAALVWKGGLL